MTEEEAEEEVEKMKLRAQMMRGENHKLSSRREDREDQRERSLKGGKGMKFLKDSQKEAYFGENDLGERINRMTHYREKIHEDSD